MSRKTSESIGKTITREMWDKWRILLRRPEFQRDLRKYMRHLREGRPYDRKIRELLTSWGVAWTPSFEILHDPRVPELSQETIILYESFFGESPLYEPVSAFDAYDGPYDGWVRPASATDRGQQLLILVDLSYPPSRLMPRIEEELKAAIESRSKTQRHDYLPADRKRRRHDKLGSQLEVYDLYVNGEPTGKISRTLNRPLGTVRSALATAIKLIRGERPRTGRAWEKKHKSECGQCGRIKELFFGGLDLNCPEAMRYIDAGANASEAVFNDYNHQDFLPPLPVKSEKSALETWEIKHSNWFRRGARRGGRLIRS